MKQREKIIECADGIIDSMQTEIILPKIIEYFIDDVEKQCLEQHIKNGANVDKNLIKQKEKIIKKCYEIANKIYNQIKLRM